MSNDKDKKGFKPGDFFSIIINMTVTISVAWIIFNLVLAGVGFLFVRLANYDVDPLKVNLADWLTKDRLINLQEVAPGIQTIRHVIRMDTDADEDKEWLVVYSYDRTQRNRGPFGAAVYDVDRCRPPAIVTYELRPYNYDYVAENLSPRSNVTPSMEDLNADGRPELVLHFGNDLSLFRWYDRTQDCTMPGPDQQGYQVLGTFRGTGGVKAEDDGRIAVLDRGFFERSQMAVKRVYVPDASGSYLRPDGSGLYEPKEVGIDFTFGLPMTATQLYYPEKAVLAFYLNLAKDNKAAKAYLSDDARSRYPISDHDFGIALPRDELDRVLVKEISYSPNADTERLHVAQQVSITVVGVRADGIADEANPRRVTWRVVGVSREGALPYNCEWRLDLIESVLTP